MDWLTYISMVFSRQGQPSISQGRLSRNYYIIIWCILQECVGFTWRFVWLWRISGGSLEDEITVRCGKVVMVDENVKRG